VEGVLKSEAVDKNLYNFLLFVFCALSLAMLPVASGNNLWREYAVTVGTLAISAIGLAILLREPPNKP
jgi:hypothetical protein